MNVRIDWKKLLKAVARSAAPFFVGALGGLATGCYSTHDIINHFFA